jgi:hypothetical protein
MTRFGSSDTGLAAAVFAAVISWVYSIYRFSSHPEDILGHGWTLYSLAVGAACLFAAWAVDEHPFVARATLALAGLSRLALFVLFGEVGASWVALAQELLPALLALFAALTIRPAGRLRAL